MARQAGMTLIELTVVLLVLIGLAGLMIPYVGGFVAKTHDSSGADNIGNVTKAIAQYDAQFAGYPQGWDSLVDGNGTGVTATYLMNDAVATATVLDTVNTQSLFRGGLSQFNGMCDGNATIGTLDADGCEVNFNPTFNANDASGSFEINMMGMTDLAGSGTFNAVTEKLAVVAPADVERVCGIQNADADADADLTIDNIYVALGISQNSTMIGKTMQDAPVHFAQVGAMNANNRYNRFVAIFKVDNDNTVGRSGSSDNASFVCSAMAMSVLEGQQEAIQRYYDGVEG